MGNNPNHPYSLPSTKKILASLLIFSSLVSFNLPAFAETPAVAKKLSAVTPANSDKADNVGETLKRALMRKKYPNLLKKEDQVLQEQRQEKIKQKLSEDKPRIAPQAETVPTKPTKIIERPQIKSSSKNTLTTTTTTKTETYTAPKSSNIFFVNAGGDYLNLKSKDASYGEFKHQAFVSKVGLGWTAVLNKEWGITSGLDFRFYPKTDKPEQVADDNMIKGFGLSIVASYLLNNNSVLNFGLGREDELYTKFIINSNKKILSDIESEAVNKVKFGWSYLIQKYATGKNGFNLNLEALLSGDNLNNAVRYGASYFFDFVVNKDALMRLEFNVDHVKKETDLVKDINETRLGGALRYHF